MRRLTWILILGLTPIFLMAQTHGYWQQEADYKMDIDFDVKKNTFKGKQKIRYTNNSPDTLDRIYLHLYFNAFQPNSAMDVRSRNISDPDRRVGDRISKLNEKEIGYQNIKSLKVKGKKVDFIVEGTVLEGRLSKKIYPGETVAIETKFDAQVPLQIRRSGRDNKEGIRYSMTQWYPKIAEYDEQGWHPNPYIGREFHGPWGDFDVKIKIAKDYIVGGSGILKSEKVRRGKKTYHFFAENVIDFAWAADPDYVVETYTAYNGTVMKFYYQPGEKTTDKWQKLGPIMDKALKYMNENFGEYPYPVYSFIQGGDGGMEYPMCTLITGERNLGSLVGVSVHEWMHSWYQMMLATNESLYPWMDEGFTTYGSAQTMNHLAQLGVLGKYEENPMESRVKGFAGYAGSKVDEPISTHADHFNTNTAYGVGSYNKGSIYLEQLRYIIGDKPFKKGMLKYFNTWKFKHPNPYRFIRIMEKESDMVLDWYNEYWINTTKYPDYAVESVDDNKIVLKRRGLMPMPTEVEVMYKDGTSKLYYIPLAIMRGEKKFPSIMNVEQLKDWSWTHPIYEIKTDTKDIEKIEINPTHNVVDTNSDNNIWTR